MASVAVHPPKTPVTKGSNGVAVATLPNICKMPPPPPPFCPTPLPNIGQSGKNPKGYSTTVKVEGAVVAITGSSFDSVGDIASKATGGGIVSNNAEGPTKFISPGELSVKVHNKFVQYLGDQMLNNCGPPGAPPNSATMQGEVQAPVVVWADVLKEIACKCDSQVKANKQSTCRQLGTDKHDCCNKEIQKRKNKTGPGRQDQLAPERGYTNPNSPPVSQIKMSRFDSFKGGQNKGSCWPDALLLDEKGKPKQLFDFKFKCPAGTRTRKKKDGSWATCSGNQPTPNWTTYKNGTTQFDKYVKLGDALGIDSTENPPTVVTNEGCK